MEKGVGWLVGWLVAMATTAAEAANANANSSDAPLNYAKIIKLFTNKHTCRLYERHCGVLSRICRHNQSGYRMQDLPHIHRIISIAADHLEEGEDRHH